MTSSSPSHMRFRQAAADGSGRIQALDILTRCTAMLLLAGLALASELTLNTVVRSGTWTTSAGADVATPRVSTSCTWSGMVTESGRYEVFIPIPADARSAVPVNNRAAADRIFPEVVYTVVAADGSHLVKVDQKASAGQERSLGSFDFTARTPIQVHLSPSTIQFGDLIDTTRTLGGPYGVNQLWASAQPPRLVRTGDTSLPPPVRRILVISASTAISPQALDTAETAWNGWNDWGLWFCKDHGPSAAPAMQTLLTWARERRYAMTEAYDAGWCQQDILAGYDAVVLLHETPPFSDPQYTALETYVRQGGGLAGLHACVNMDGRIGRLLGAAFAGVHPHTNVHYPDNKTETPIVLTVPPGGVRHPATAGIRRPDHPEHPVWNGFDEWYLWLNGDSIQGVPLLTESAGVLRQKDGRYATPHVVSWMRDAAWWTTADPNRSPDPGQGRTWYTSMGHSYVDCFPGNFSTGYRLDPVGHFIPAPIRLGTGRFTYLEHLTGGILSVMGVTAPPTLTTVSPTNGLEAGGTTVTLTGSHLAGITTVTFGGIPATQVTVVDDATVTCVTPAHAVGDAPVIAAGSDGASLGDPLFAFIAPTTYYLSASGSDSNSGKSITTPWKTLAKLAAATVVPGDQVLLRGGDAFTGPLTVRWSGNAQAPITLGSYGTGRATIRAPDDATPGIALTDQGGIVIQDLRVERLGSRTSSRGGIDARYTNQRSLRGLTIRNVQASGFLHGLWCSAATGTAGNAFRGLTITGCEFANNRANGLLIAGSGVASIQDVVIRSCLAYGNTGDPTFKKSNGDKEIDGSGYEVRGVTRALIEKCLARDNGETGYAGSGIWTWNCSQVTMRFCEVYGQKAQDHSDGGGFDYDGGAQDGLIEYCYSHDNAGAGFMLYTWPEAVPQGFQENRGNVIRYCVSRDDGRQREYGGLLLSGGKRTDATGNVLESKVSNAWVYHNTIIATASASSTYTSTYAVRLGESLAGVHLHNNVFVSGGYCGLITSVATQATEVVLGNNLYAAQPGTNSAFRIRWGTRNHGSWDAWRTASGQEATGGLNADPLLTGPATAGPAAVTLEDTADLDVRLAGITGYTPLPTSPLIDTGLDLRTVAAGGIDVGTHDFVSSGVPVGSRFDIGALERAEPGFRSAATASGQEGVAFRYQPVTAPAAASYDATGLPPGLAIDSVTGAITGTPTTAGTFTIILTGTLNGQTGRLTLTLTITGGTTRVSRPATATPNTLTVP